jgi:hypothetical protein
MPLRRPEGGALMYFTEANVEPITTTREEMLAGNYIKQLAKGGIPTQDEKDAYHSMVAKLPSTHRPDCYCKDCVL